MNSKDTHWPIFDYPDIHSHIEGEGRVLSVDFTAIPSGFVPSGPFTLGIHPWHADSDIDWNKFEEMLRLPAIVGIGEAGLDSIKGPSMDIQLPVFEKQIELADKYNLPLVIHSVRNNHVILKLKKELKPHVPWIIHGFRGNTEAARQLIDAGIHLSLGKRSGIGDVTALNRDFIHYETDEIQDNKNI